MNKTNLSYRILALVVMVASMLLVFDLNAELYRLIIGCLGGWQLGTWVGDWSRAKWPLYD